MGPDAHYKDTRMEESEAIDIWKQGHKKNGWLSIAGINERGEIPRAYVLPKSKDLRKGRPIVPYCNHVLRPVYKIAGRALSYFLRHDADQDPDHNLGFNITRTDQYVKTVNRQSISARERYGENLKW